jgi:hypothetical protein
MQTMITINLGSSANDTEYIIEDLLEGVRTDVGPIQLILTCTLFLIDITYARLIYRVDGS